MSELKLKIQEHLIAGLKPKKALEAVGGGIEIAEVYAIAQELRKEGKLKSLKKSASKPAKKKARKAGASAMAKINGFIASATEEMLNCDSEIERLGRLAAAYDKTNSDFAAHVEKQIELKKKQKEALEDYLNG